ncbi:MAG TPA: ABC transporter substrate-binding protein [Nocardioides sp.]|uniref:ABC transporter substrate-binding protein n=1 Tax=uncultured Nocardioides sp. TaxID=198441 RepID=UPI002617D5FD|nr:ABC transporter substrate-binding protein [uncultured Nocardioides sp.]HRD64427.1 ABC transporter substrate-binding protein [Nocardioides sp.]HRI98804.1 ABC transporter substrate-binding protein [Nocardioides sp.]HRK48514.1 ABC transporter substrate-binding protein [Nocardioides sp.]
MNRSTIATRRFRRLTATVALGAALGLSLVACGDDASSGGDASEDTSSSAPTEETSESESAAPAFTNDKCAGGETSADTFKVGGILPLTGNLAFLGPPAVAGVGLAVSDINAAGGVNDAKACHDILDSGDSTDMSISTASAGTMVAGAPSVVIGAESSSVSLNFVDTLTDAKIMQISPANTAIDLSGKSPFYARTAPPDTVQGNALGTLISQDGYTNVGFLVFNDTYGTGLRNATQSTIEAAGGKCVYGCQGDGDEFPAGQTTFSAEVQAVNAAKPDAIVIIAFDETKSIVPELAASGWDMSKTYFVDGNLSDYGEDFEAGTLEGAQGTLPGQDPDQGFKDQLVAWYQQANGEELKDFSYGAESYDATILAALAAAKGGSNDSVTVQKNLAAVSGATDGTECGTYADCLALLEGGSEIAYSGPSGIGPLDDEGDPSSAFIGIYQYDAQNKNILSGTVEGSKP